MRLEELKMLQKLVQEEINTKEGIHPNCRCASTGIDMDDLADSVRAGLEELMEELVQEELCSVKPIILSVPEGEDPEAFIDRIIRGVTAGEPTIKPREYSDYEQRAMSLYNAFLYRLSVITKEIEEHRKEVPPMLGIGSHFVQDITLREGFDPVEVLEDMARKLME